MENNKDKFINDLNSALINNFEYVPAFKTINVAEELAKKGWVFAKIDNECLTCKRYYSGSCSGIADRKRETITVLNMCSGYIQCCEGN